MDEHLTWKNHINNITKKISSGTSALKRVIPFIDRYTAVKAYKGLWNSILLTARQFGMDLVINWVKNYKSYKIELLG